MASSTDLLVDGATTSGLPQPGGADARKDDLR